MYQVIRTDDEINAVLDAANDAMNECGSAYPGESYEEGLKSMLNWLTGVSDENPMEL